MGLGIFPFFCFLFAGVIGLFKQKEYLSFISRTCSSELYSFSVLIISLTNSLYTHHLFKGPLIQQHWEQETESRYLLYSGTCLAPVSLGPGLTVSAQISTLYCVPPKTSKLWLKVWLFVSLAMVVCLPSMVYVKTNLYFLMIPFCSAGCCQWTVNLGIAISLGFWRVNNRFSGLLGAKWKKKVERQRWKSIALLLLVFCFMFWKW